MNLKLLKSLVLASSFLFQAGGAQAAPYVQRAEMMISVDDFADVWLNGTQVVIRRPITLANAGGPATFLIDACLFKPENLLAVKCTDNNPANASIEYMLKVRMSNGEILVFSSREVDKHKSFFVEHPQAFEPEKWWQPGFIDKGWDEPMNLGRISSFLAMIDDRETNKTAVFMSASDTGGPIKTVGERHLFRRSIALGPIDTQACGTPTFTPTATTTNTPTSTATATPTFTKTRTPTKTETSTQTLTFTRTPKPLKPTKTWTPLYTHTPRPVPPTRTPVPIKTPTPYPPIKTNTPYRPPTKTLTPRIPTSTPTRKPPPPTRTSTQVPTRRPAPPTSTATRVIRIPTPKPRLYLLTPTPPPQALVFEHAPVRLFVEFKDGSGLYTVDVLDVDGNQVKNIFNEGVARSREDWVDWDLTDDRGRTAPSGTYQMVIRKGGRELKKIWIVIK